MTTKVSPIKILSDLGQIPWEIENDEDYIRALKEGIITIEAATKGKGDKRSVILREELIRIRKERKASPPKDINVKEKKSTIKGAKLLPGTTFRPDDVKPADVEKNGDAPALMPDRLDSIAKTVDSIALLLRRQFKVEKKQQRDSRIQQDKINKGDREDDLEKKPKDKKTGGLPKAIAKPALSFFDKIKKFFLNIVIGAGAVKLMDWLKDPANAEKVTKFKDFLINNAPLILGGLAALALLPIVGSLVSLIGGIMGGLSMLGLAVPLLPIILKGILIAAVLALTVAAGNAIKNKLTQAISGGGKFEDLDQKGRDDLLESGISQGGTLVDEKGKTLKIPAGENRRGDTIFKMGVVDPSMTDDNAEARGVATQSQVIAHIGQEEYDKKVAALLKWKNLMEEKDPIKKQMGEEIRSDKKEFSDMRKAERKKLGLSGKEKMNFNDETERLWAEKENKIREKYDKIIMEKFPEYFGKIDSSATVNKDIKSNTNVPGPSSKNKGNNVILGGGSGKQDSSGGGGSGTGGSSDNPKISSQDPNNISTIAIGSIYNMGSV